MPSSLSPAAIDGIDPDHCQPQGKALPPVCDGNSGSLDDGEAPEAQGGEINYEPHLLIHWRLNYRTQTDSRRRILDFAVNLVTGHLETGIIITCRAALWLKTSALIPTAKRRVGFRAAYKMMTDEIRYILTVEDNSWAKKLAGTWTRKSRFFSGTDDRLLRKRRR